MMEVLCPFQAKLLKLNINRLTSPSVQFRNVADGRLRERAEAPVAIQYSLRFASRSYIAMLKGMCGPHLQTDKWKGELDNLVQNSTTVDEQVKHLTEALSEKATAAQTLSDQVKEVSVFPKEHHSICPCSLHKPWKCKLAQWLPDGRVSRPPCALVDG
jgi:hypothetical protein